MHPKCKPRVAKNLCLLWAKSFHVHYHDFSSETVYMSGSPALYWKHLRKKQLLFRSRFSSFSYSHSRNVIYCWCFPIDLALSLFVIHEEDGLDELGLLLPTLSTANPKYDTNVHQSMYELSLLSKLLLVSNYLTNCNNQVLNSANQQPHV